MVHLLDLSSRGRTDARNTLSDYSEVMCPLRLYFPPSISILNHTLRSESIQYRIDAEVVDTQSSMFCVWTQL